MEQYLDNTNPSEDGEEKHPANDETAQYFGRAAINVATHSVQTQAIPRLPGDSSIEHGGGDETIKEEKLKEVGKPSSESSKKKFEPGDVGNATSQGETESCPVLVEKIAGLEKDVKNAVDEKYSKLTNIIQEWDKSTSKRLDGVLTKIEGFLTALSKSEKNMFDTFFLYANTRQCPIFRTNSATEKLVTKSVFDYIRTIRDGSTEICVACEGLHEKDAFFDAVILPVVQSFQNNYYEALSEHLRPLFDEYARCIKENDESALKDDSSRRPTCMAKELANIKLFEDKTSQSEQQKTKPCKDVLECLKKIQETKTEEYTQIYRKVHEYLIARIEFTKYYSDSIDDDEATRLYEEAIDNSPWN